VNRSKYEDAARTWAGRMARSHEPPRLRPARARYRTRPSVDATAPAVASAPKRSFHWEGVETDRCLHMKKTLFSLWLAFSSLLLSACVTAAIAEREDAEKSKTSSSWLEARADPDCVVPVCDEERCALWRCIDLVEVEESPVILTRGTPTVPPSGTFSPRRWWGYPLAAPSLADPVFEIPWHNWNVRGQLHYRDLRPLCIIPPREPLEKHHIFPQEPTLASWFKLRDIDIHSFTIRIPKKHHNFIHSGGPKGGQWNEAWRQFAKTNRGASQAEVWRFAFELMSRFGLGGPLVPYYCD